MQDLSVTWIADMAFLFDITQHLNALSVGLDWHQRTRLTHKTFKTKLELFQDKRIYEQRIFTFAGCHYIGTGSKSAATKKQKF